MRLFDARSKALAQAGLVRGIDLVLAITWLLIGVTLLFDRLFNPHFGQADLIAGLGGLLVLQSFWSLILVYRACKLVIEVRADVNLMPESAAKLARLGYGDRGLKPEPKA